MKASQCPIKIVGEWTLYVERQHPRFSEARKVLNQCASILLRTPSLFAYKLDISYLWNSCAQEIDIEELINKLKSLSKGTVPNKLILQMRDIFLSYRRYKLSHDFFSPVVSDCLANVHTDLFNWHEIVNIKAEYAKRKKAIVDERIPLFSTTRALPLHINQACKQYQKDAINTFTNKKRPSGMLTLPCGAGKTFIAIGILLTISKNGLVLCPSKISIIQWLNEIKKWLQPNENSTALVIEELFPSFFKVTITQENSPSQEIYLVGYLQSTNLLTFSPNFFDVVIFDEAHQIPQKLESISSIYAYTQRIGLTATLSRKDNYLLQLHNLIGPTLFNLSWEEVQKAKAITIPTCIEVKLPLTREMLAEIEGVNKKDAKKTLALNTFKYEVLSELLEKHNNDSVLIFASYTSQIEYLKNNFDIEVITGKTPLEKRILLIESFKAGRLKKLAFSKLGSAAIDLPNANIAIQLSGTMASRQEEAQQVGRLMRPKPDDIACLFYTLVSDHKLELELSSERQLFLAEQGIPYITIFYEEL